MYIAIIVSLTDFLWLKPFQNESFRRRRRLSMVRRRSWREEDEKKKMRWRRWGEDDEVKTMRRRRWGEDAEEKTMRRRRWGEDAEEKTLRRRRWGEDDEVKTMRWRRWGEDDEKMLVFLCCVWELWLPYNMCAVTLFVLILKMPMPHFRWFIESSPICHYQTQTPLWNDVILQRYAHMWPLRPLTCDSDVDFSLNVIKYAVLSGLPRIWQPVSALARR